jgi:hypothetical protein
MVGNGPIAQRRGSNFGLGPLAFMEIHEETNDEKSLNDNEEYTTEDHSPVFFPDGR